MIMLMGILRRSLIVVVMAVAAVTSAFDGCLLDCHPQAQASAAETHAHCHPPALSSVEGASPQQARARWQADPTCHHDHTVAAAESTARSRVDSRPLCVAAPLQTPAVRPRVAISLLAGRSTPDRPGSAVALVPLRV
jgi:hypothetical protein